VSVCALKGKRLELSTPTWYTYSLAVTRRSKGQRSRSHGCYSEVCCCYCWGRRGMRMFLVRSTLSAVLQRQSLAKIHKMSDVISTLSQKKNRQHVEMFCSLYSMSCVATRSRVPLGLHSTWALVKTRSTKAFQPSVFGKRVIAWEPFQEKGRLKQWKYGQARSTKWVQGSPTYLYKIKFKKIEWNDTIWHRLSWLGLSMHLLISAVWINLVAERPVPFCVRYSRNKLTVV